MAKGNFGANKTGFTRMPVRLTSQPSQVRTKYSSFGNSTGGRVSSGKGAGLGRFPNAFNKR